MIEDTEAVITARLRQVARLNLARPRRGPVDMSEEAITRRLREVSALRRLCIALGAATRVPPQD